MGAGNATPVCGGLEQAKSRIIGIAVASGDASTGAKVNVIKPLLGRIVSGAPCQSPGIARFVGSLAAS